MGLVQVIGLVVFATKIIYQLPTHPAWFLTKPPSSANPPLAFGKITAGILHLIFGVKYMLIWLVHGNWPGHFASNDNYCSKSPCFKNNPRWIRKSAESTGNTDKWIRFETEDTLRISKVLWGLDVVAQKVIVPENEVNVEKTVRMKPLKIGDDGWLCWLYGLG